MMDKLSIRRKEYYRCCEYCNHPFMLGERKAMLTLYDGTTTHQRFLHAERCLADFQMVTHGQIVAILEYGPEHLRFERLIEGDARCDA